MYWWKVTFTDEELKRFKKLWPNWKIFFLREKLWDDTFMSSKKVKLKKKENPEQFWMLVERARKYWKENVEFYVDEKWRRCINLKKFK